MQALTGRNPGAMGIAHQKMNSQIFESTLWLQPIR
jgi:hypothetical protein